MSSLPTPRLLAHQPARMRAIPYHATPYLTPYQTTPNLTIIYHFISYRTIPHYTTANHTNHTYQSIEEDRASHENAPGPDLHVITTPVSHTLVIIIVQNIPGRNLKIIRQPHLHVITTPVESSSLCSLSYIVLPSQKILMSSSLSSPNRCNHHHDL